MSGIISTNNPGLTGSLQALTSIEAEDMALKLRNEMLNLLLNHWIDNNAAIYDNEGWTSEETGHVSLFHCQMMALIGAIKQWLANTAKDNDDFLYHLDEIISNLKLTKNPFMAAVERALKRKSA